MIHFKKLLTVALTLLAFGCTCTVGAVESISVLELAEDKEQRKTLFDFLKSKEFISVIREKPMAPKTYSHFGG